MIHVQVLAFNLSFLFARRDILSTAMNDILSWVGEYMHMHVCVHMCILMRDILQRLCGAYF